jgi:hypothetical protein
VKKTPDITDIIGEKGERDEGAKGRRDEGEKGEREKGESGERDVENDNETETKNTEQETPPHTSHLTPHTSNLTPQTSFPDHWRAMFEQVFASVPTIFLTLKETLPEVENNIIKFVVKNEVQKEHFEAKTREVLAYLRTHFSEQVEDIIVETNELLETKKIIYDVKDKLQNFKEQNEEFEDFMQILELKIKD